MGEVRTEIRTLLICDDIPSSSYGTGQRLLAIKKALDTLGECRILHLTNGEKPAELAFNDYIAPLPISKNASRFQYILRNLTFSSYRYDSNYNELFEIIMREFSFDVVVCSFLRNSPVVPKIKIPCLLDIDALDEPQGIVTRLIWPITKLMIRKRGGDFEKIFVIRPRDAYIFSESKKKDIVFLPGFSATALPHLTSTKRDNYVLMVGSMNWLPNKEAVDFLITGNLPGLLNSRGWKLKLVGSGTDRYRGIDGVVAEGFVDDLNAVYASSGVVICPIWSGSGANIKLAEAIQHGRAVISTKHAAEAYSSLLEPQRDFLVADNKLDFIRATLRVIDDQLLRGSLEKHAQKVAKNNFTQSHFTAIIANAIRQSVN
ncbi:MAG: hypothetical protein COA90_08565 [Gammaproteobacteria bacterium]|nr:MAG: hypothetical protein COA90_08565 [Gammaproteobacteria bacterium]